MPNQVPNAWKKQLWYPYFFNEDVFKAILMQPGFKFDKDDHKTYANVSEAELPDGNGYTKGGLVLTGIALFQDDVENRAELTFHTIQWVATGGSLSASGAILYMEKVAGGIYELTNPLISYKDAGGVITAVEGTPIVVSAVMETTEDK